MYAFRIDLPADRDYRATEFTIIATLHHASTQTYDIDAYANAVTKYITKTKNIILILLLFLLEIWEGQSIPCSCEAGF